MANGVFRMIRMSFQVVRVSMYSRSISSHLSNGMSLRCGEICQVQVMPGVTISRSRS